MAAAVALAAGGCKQSPAVGNSMLDVGLMRVQDGAGIIPATEEIALARKSEALEQATTDQLVVVTVPSLHGQDIAPFSTAFANRLGAGQADKDNGVLLVVAPNERKVRIAVGYGLEGLLTDERAAGIVQHMLPYFRAGDQARAIRTGVDEVDVLLRSDKRRPQLKKAA
ncbi:MAG TPA: TPM domain-containing protein [Sphingomicrobium sp.]